MQTSKTESKRKRRRGSYAEELANETGISVYKAKQCIKVVDKVHKLAPELGSFIASGVLKFRDAIPLLEALKEAPELIPLVASGKYPLDKCLQELKEAKEEADDELSFEEKVEQSFERWLRKWPKDKRREIWSVIDDTFDAFFD